MYKCFCDLCKRELQNRRSDDINVLIGSVSENITFTLQFSAIDMDIHVCRYCMIDAVKALDNRPSMIRE